LSLIPVFVLAADADAQTRDELKWLGAKDYVVKGSLSASKLVVRIKRAMQPPEQGREPFGL
jgi:hypothetical protein